MFAFWADRGSYSPTRNAPILGFVEVPPGRRDIAQWPDPVRQAGGHWFEPSNAHRIAERFAPPFGVALFVGWQGKSQGSSRSPQGAASEPEALSESPMHRPEGPGGSEWLTTRRGFGILARRDDEKVRLTQSGTPADYTSNGWSRTDFAVAGILCVIFAFAAGPWSFGQQAISVRAAEVGFWLASAFAYAYFGFCLFELGFSIHFEA